MPPDSLPSGPRKRRARGGRKPTRARPEPDGADWIYGIHPVREALRAGRRRLEGLRVRDGPPRPELEELVALAQAAGVPVERLPRAVLDRALPSDVQSQGVALGAGPLPELSLKEWLAAEIAADRWLVALDGVEDPQNVGAIARVAESAGAAGLLLADRRAPGLTASVARASAGAIEWLPVVRAGNLVRSLGALKRAGFWIVAASMEGESASLFDLSDELLSGPLVIVLGAEGRGIRPGVLAEADHRVWIPMRGRVSSLNVSTAAAVVLFDLVRRRAHEV